ncbi:hypothetical protein A1O3_04102 [Capronia epimyces CBS 606.96]|uniref:BZIP domain-containing protein n=1 Tax=Capronia epimyces CBS 606.96 TaxID=1182542 RepID=W9YXW7_9EURO|nr:uncharacterized protein A1O3_04102 [Capronia epimyces CBS 606.96]EXJ87144.1 hypothetical protein A1O3_04102 [Capronia epimyces CBS 606.96]
MNPDTPPSGQMSSPVESAESRDNKGVSSRRLKKREIDRRCQRQARERTKTRIAYLEGLVEDFRRQDSSGQVATLMAQLQEVQAERELMAKALKEIQKTMDMHKPLKEKEQELEQALECNRSQSLVPSINPHVDCKPSLTSFADDAPPPLKAEGAAVWPANIPMHNFDLAIHSPPLKHAPEVVRLDNGSLLPPSQALVQAKAAREPDPLTPLRYADYWAAPRQACSCTSCHGRGRDRRPGHRAVWQGNYWKYFNEVLSERFEWSNVGPESDAQADDVPVRAMVEGWDAVVRRGPLHPSWQILRRIDESLFARSPKAARLAILRAMHLLLQFHTDSTTERYSRLPPWYMRRPSQNLAHSYAIDYFPWPGIRERFVFNEHDYCGNDFWYGLCKSLRLLWPYEFRDCYTREVETGLYKVSRTFDQRITDIRSWAMGPDFFQQYPELYNDIPAFDHISFDHISHTVGPKRRPSQKRLLPTPGSPETIGGTSEEEEIDCKPRSPEEDIQMQVRGYQPRQTTQSHSQNVYPNPQHDLNQHMYNISDFNPIVALDAFAYGAVNEVDFANVYQPEMPECYPDMIY